MKHDLERTYVVTSTNNAEDDGKILMMLSYDKNQRETLKEALRPTGCCTIFWARFFVWEIWSQVNKKFIKVEIIEE